MRTFDKYERRVQMKQKRRFLQYMENDWFVMKNTFNTDYPYTFVKHFVEKKNNRWRIKQLVLSGYFEQDGLYILHDFDLRKKIDKITGEKKVEMTLWDFSLEIGYQGEKVNVSNYTELYHALLEEGVVTTKEWKEIFSTQTFQEGKREIVLLPGVRRKEVDVNASS